MADRTKTADKSAALGSEKIARLVLRFTASTFTALLFNTLYSVTDALFVSWGVGANAMGGVSLSLPFIILQGAIAQAVGSEAASIVSRRLGEGKPGMAGEATLNALFTFYTTALLTTLLGFLFLEQLLRAMGVTGELYAYTRQYMVILLAGNVFSTGFSNIIRAEGRMTYAMLIWVVPVSVNILLDALFILGFGWGVPGSALATVICQFTSAAMSILFFTRFSSQVFKGARLRPGLIGEIFTVGFPTLVQMGSLSVSTLLMNNVIGRVGGTAGLNTYAYVSKILTFVIMPFTAFTQALSPIVGYNYGTGSSKRVRDTVRFCTLLSFGYALAALVLTGAFPTLLMRAFTPDAALIEAGAAGLRVVCLSFLCMPLPMLAGATFQALGQRLWALALYAANLVLQVPLVLALSTAFGMGGVWWAYVLGYTGASVFAAVRLLAFTRRDLRG